MSRKNLKVAGTLERVDAFSSPVKVEAQAVAVAELSPEDVVVGELPAEE